MITSFSHNANGTPGSIRAVVVGAGTGTDEPHDPRVQRAAALTPGTLNTFPTRIPVPGRRRPRPLHQRRHNMVCNFGTADAG